jgi:predicted aspartyl protease
MSRTSSSLVLAALVSITTASVPAPAPGAGAEAVGSANPAIDAVLAKVQAARGNTAPVQNETELWRIHEFGSDGTLRRVSRGRDWTETRTRDKLVTAEGSSGGTTWRQNENGEVIVEQDDGGTDADVRPASLRMARVHDPVEAYVIQTIAANGSTRLDYYDPVTFHLVRRERNEFGTHSFEVFEDYTTNAAGRTFARHEYGADDRPDNDWDQRLVSDDLTTPVSAADVAIPANRRTLVEFPQGRSTVRLPAKIERGLIVVRVAVAGTPLDFILDSGASAIVLDGETADRLGLAFSSKGTATVAGSVAERQAIVPQMDVGDLTLRNVVIDTLPFSLTLDESTTAVGLLGFDFLDGAAVTVDYAGGTVDATVPEAFAPPAQATSIRAAMNFGAPEVSLAVGGLQGDRFVVDTGAQEATVVLFQHFARTHQAALAAPLLAGFGQRTTRDMIGGSVTNTRVLLKDVNFGPWTFSDVHGLLSNSPRSFDSQDGLIGSDFLGLFKLTLDEPHSRVFLEPSGPLPGEVPSPAGYQR